MTDPKVIFTIINPDGSEEKIQALKLRAEFSNGAKVTIEANCQREEIMLRGYSGPDEFNYNPDSKTVLLNIAPGACNLIRIIPSLL